MLINKPNKCHLADSYLSKGIPGVPDTVLLDHWILSLLELEQNHTIAVNLLIDFSPLLSVYSCTVAVYCCSYRTVTLLHNYLKTVSIF